MKPSIYSKEYVEYEEKFWNTVINFLNEIGPYSNVTKAAYKELCNSITYEFDDWRGYSVITSKKKDLEFTIRRIASHSLEHIEFRKKCITKTGVEEELPEEESYE